VAVTDSFNDNSTNNSHNSTTTDNSTNLWVKLEDSFNDNSTNVVTTQELNGAVANVTVIAGALLAKENEISSGDIEFRGNAMQGFAGINTMNQNTGIASLGQAATAVGANANVTFGN